MADKKPPWELPSPKKRVPTPLSDEWKRRARERAEAAGRRYPNLVDNMWAMREQRAAKKQNP